MRYDELIKYYNPEDYEFFENSEDYEYTLYDDVVNNIKYYDVISDDDLFWVRFDTLVKICKEIDPQQLIYFTFEMDNNIVIGECYISVTESFLDFVKDNTFNPKYLPKFLLLGKKVQR